MRYFGKMSDLHIIITPKLKDKDQFVGHRINDVTISLKKHEKIIVDQLKNGADNVTTVLYKLKQVVKIDF